MQEKEEQTEKKAIEENAIEKLELSEDEKDLLEGFFEGSVEEQGEIEQDQDLVTHMFGGLQTKAMIKVIFGLVRAKVRRSQINDRALANYRRDMWIRLMYLTKDLEREEYKQLGEKYDPFGPRRSWTRDSSEGVFQVLDFLEKMLEDMI